ncbi:MAG: M23 family metallopeptidase, partial [Gammaproteobacteria bacterium]|nr:M23 family metallopeptidase [Gammaproteobacteria bacterium]
RYAHNKENLVAVGERVEKGQLVGYMGSTGRATGANLHFEVLFNGRPVDPLDFIGERN